jgi:protein-disulfide isomerase
MPDRLALPVSARDHVRGAAGAPVTLVEYGDFECPHCGAAYPVLKELQARFGDRLRLVFRHFPLTNVHPHAQAAAEAAEFAAAHGRFWEMHDAIYQHQKELSAPTLLALTAELGLEGSALTRSLAEHSFFARVKEDFLGGIKSGVKGTPAFFVDGVRHEGDLKALGDAIAAASSARSA